MTTEKACSVGSSIDDKAILSIKTARLPWLRPNRIVVKISGLRRGFKDTRFGEKTKAQFDANERRLNLDEY